MELSTDLVVVGGGVGGVAAALAAARHGLAVILTEETDWLGGQLTSQAVPPDEHPWIEQFGCTRSYRDLRDGIRSYYRRFFPLSQRARDAHWLNPGDGVVSSLCHEPRVAVAVIESMLAPYASMGRVRVLLRHVPIAADMDGDGIRTVTMERLRDGQGVVLTAPYVIDATETGQLLALTKTEYVTGFESQSDTGEPHAPAEAQPLNMQSVTMCFAVEHLAGEDHTIDKPKQYDHWRSHRFPAWPGPQLSWTSPRPRTGEPFDAVLLPNPARETPRKMDMPPSTDLWRYRRIAARHNFASGTYASDITLANWPMLDYVGGPLFEVDELTASRHRENARQLSLSFLYWLQTEAPRPDGGHGYRGLRLRGDLMGTDDGLAKYPYIRESRRIRAVHTVTEQDVVLDPDRPHPVTTFPDSVGVGAYSVDLHPSTGGDGFIDVSTGPFEIPLGALLPVRVRNLLPGAKNIGTTHITNGCYRLHPIEWNIGEASALLAVYCLAQHTEPRQVRDQPGHLRAYQNLLGADGVELHWPSDHLNWPAYVNRADDR